MFNWLRRRSKPSPDPKPDAPANTGPDDGRQSGAVVELYRLFAELARPGQAGGLPRRIDLLQRALALVDRRTQADTWAGLQGELGNALARTYHGDPAQNLDRAIVHFGQALE